MFCKQNKPLRKTREFRDLTVKSEILIIYVYILGLLFTLGQLKHIKPFNYIQTFSLKKKNLKHCTQVCFLTSRNKVSFIFKTITFKGTEHTEYQINR